MSDQTPSADTAESELLQRLVRGAELLQGGQLEEARAEIEAALERRPESQRGQNLLALCCFKLGLFDRAETLYRTLIADHPEDPALRVNLGLVCLKVGRPEEAAEAFTSVLDRLPDHPKAANYLGLAYAQLRDFARAREWFLRAGNTAMAERMADQQEPAGELTAGVVGGWRSSPPVPAGEVLIPPFEPSNPDLNLTRLFAGRATPAPSEQTLADEQTFTIEAEHTAIDLRQGDVFLRLDSLLALWGNVDLKPTFKHHRGRQTEKPFGDGGRRVCRGSGTGRVWIARNSRQLCVLDVSGTPTFLREEAVVAFESRLPFDNGRLVSRQAGEVALIHLRDHGQALLSAQRGLRPVEVTREEPCRVPPEMLLGWQGDLVPRLLPLVEGEGGAVPLVIELAGAGTVFLDAAP